MKLRKTILFIALIAMLAFIGIGFASWTFTNEVEQGTDTEATPKIVCAIELNDDFELYNATTNTVLSTIYLICDAPATGLNTLAGHGVYWSSANNATAWANKIDNVYIKGTLNYNAYDIAEVASVTVTFAVGTNFALTNGTYVEFAAATLPADKVVAVANNAEVKSVNFALPVPSYNSGVNTTNFNSVADVADITDGLSGLVIAYKAYISAQTLN